MKLLSRMLAGVPPRSAPGDNSSSDPAASGKQDAELEQALLRLQTEKSEAAEEATAREKELEKSLRDAQKARF